jgi:hypothetical protein
MRYNNHLDRDLINILNVLSLLRDKPMTYEELWKSGCFKKLKHLEIVMHKLHKAGLVEKIKAANIWVILGNGITLLSLYPDWRPLRVEVLDTVDPVGKESSVRRRVRGVRFNG